MDWAETDCYLSGVSPPQRNATLNAFKFLRNVYLCYFSKPVADRALYRLLRKRSVKSIVEIGVGQLQRTARLLELAFAGTVVGALFAPVGGCVVPGLLWLAVAAALWSSYASPGVSFSLAPSQVQ